MKKLLISILSAFFLLFANNVFATPYTINLSGLYSGNLYASYASNFNVQSIQVNTGTSWSNLNLPPTKAFQDIGADGFSDGDTFNEFGFIAKISIDSSGVQFGIDTDSNGTPDAAAQVYLRFDNLSGFVTDVVDTFDYSLVFDPTDPATTIGLWLDDDGDYSPLTGNAIQLASYDLLTGSGTGPSLESTGQITGDLSFSSAVTDLQDIFAFNTLGLTFQEMQTNFGPNAVISTIDVVSEVTAIDQSGDPWEIELQQTGDETISAVPEPTSIVLLGFGLLGLAGVTRRKFK